MDEHNLVLDVPLFTNSIDGCIQDFYIKCSPNSALENKMIFRSVNGLGGMGRSMTIRSFVLLFLDEIAIRTM